MIISYVKPNEKSTAKFTISVTDSEGTAVTPKTDLLWTLCKADGTVVDTGEVTAALSMIVILSGDQLAISSDELDTASYNLVFGKKVYYVKRSLTVSTTIDTDIGNDLPVTQEFIFLIDNTNGLA